ncbi:Microcystin-dependent protein [Chitinophaga sp. CF118]|uniref:phage tail protein n=1 Tax=Chitinophaga sp. CF118 TaxID=1884367 RepID=UPI0008EEA4E4|nr:tail fiber protein [Chitinophaga sp. CF118]SFD15490.1 Microcystin-dependent protein [Chitinophaga sp. CF118]
MDNFIGEIRLFGFDRTPRGWAVCSGQLMSISQNSALFSLLGVYYGGDGITTFALPNLNGRAIIGEGSSLSGTTYPIGSVGGTENVTLTTNNIPSHNHLVSANISYDLGSPSANYFANANTSTNVGNKNKATVNLFAPQGGTPAPLAPAITSSGGSIPHENRMPFLVMNYCIATIGIYPSRQ